MEEPGQVQEDDASFEEFCKQIHWDNSDFKDYSDDDDVADPDFELSMDVDDEAEGDKGDNAEAMEGNYSGNVLCVL